MVRKLILKFDTKEGNIRCDMYKAESIRISGRAKSLIVNDSNAGTIHHTLNDLIMQLDSEFEIGFKKNNLKSIKAWIVANIFKVYIRGNVSHEIRTGIIKLLGPKTIIIND